MADYIDRQMALDAIKYAEPDCEYEAVEAVPPADVQPVRHGHWIISRFGADARCSVCGYYFNDAYDMENEDNYCRHCGALMDGDMNDKR